MVTVGGAAKGAAMNVATMADQFTLPPEGVPVPRLKVPLNGPVPVTTVCSVAAVEPAVGDVGWLLLRRLNPVPAVGAFVGLIVGVMKSVEGSPTPAKTSWVVLAASAVVLPLLGALEKPKLL